MKNYIVYYISRSQIFLSKDILTSRPYISIITPASISLSLQIYLNGVPPFNYNDFRFFTKCHSKKVPATPCRSPVWSGLALIISTSLHILVQLNSRLGPSKKREIGSRKPREADGEEDREMFVIIHYTKSPGQLEP